MLTLRKLLEDVLQQNESKPRKMTGNNSQDNSERKFQDDSCRVGLANNQAECRRIYKEDL